MASVVGVNVGRVTCRWMRVLIAVATLAAACCGVIAPAASAASGPTVTTDPPNDLAPTHATLRGRVNPEGSATTYYFEYGASTSYGASVPATRDADAGSGGLVLGVVRRVDHLEPGTTYHYRLVATSQVSTVQGADQAFATTAAPPPSSERAGIPGAGFLPDSRGWEQVSPLAKNGGDIMGDSARTRAASGETPTLPMAITYPSISGFGDVHGTGVATEYMSVRSAQPGSSGWTSHAITPAQDPGTWLTGLQAADPLFEGEFSSDLASGIFRAWSPVTQAPMVAATENLYTRHDLRTPGPGSYQLLTDCPACSSPLDPFSATPQIPRLAGTSSDFSHVIFESTYALTSGATAGNSNLYESVNGNIRLAGILPDSACGTPPCPASSSLAGQGAGTTTTLTYTPHTISDDGSRIFFTDPSSGTLYVRVDGTSTIQISGSQPATFWTATPDGRRAFFTTSEQLTNDDTNGTVDLYMWDGNQPAGQQLTRLSTDNEPSDGTGDVQGVIGTSNDGHYVYFIAAGQLVADQPVPVSLSLLRIYVWHDGVVTHIGQLNRPSDAFVDLPGNWNLFPFAARVSPDGRHLLFTSSDGEGLTGYDHGICGTGFPCAEVYVYSADANTLHCASCNPSGAPATANATIDVRSGSGASDSSWHLSHALSDDGRRVFFSTAEALVPQDTNGKVDAYEFDVPTGTVHLLSKGTGTANSYFMDASANGDDAFILTREQLVGWDTDQSYDLYDARVNGGVPDPPTPPPGCAGDSCQEDLGAGPGGTPPASATFTGAGNERHRTAVRKRPKPLRCRHGYVRKKVKGKVRCVKKPTSRHARKSATRPHSTPRRTK